MQAGAQPVDGSRRGAVLLDLVELYETILRALDGTLTAPVAQKAAMASHHTLRPRKQLAMR